MGWARRRARVLGLLLRALLLRLLVFLCQMTANHAAHRRTDERMVMGVMPGHGAGDGPLDATFGIRRNGRKRDRQR